jgi:D-glycero-D-manno-heptose 1,7-bisphosphate phosphatase
VVNSSIIKENKPFSPRTLDQVQILPNVVKSINLLKKAGLPVIIITNQPDVSKGLMKYSSLQLINNQIKRLTGIDRIYSCIHLDRHECECRKPKIGMIRSAANDFNLDLKSSFLVGDRWKDIEAGQLAGCKCFFIDYGYNEKKPVLPFTKVNSLLEAAVLILKEVKNDRTK